MTDSAAQAVLDRMESDEGFAQRVKYAGSPEASLALLEAEGFEVTPQDMRDAVLDRYGDQLSAEQLDAIAGGASSDDFYTFGSVTLVAATFTAFAASVAAI